MLECAFVDQLKLLEFHLVFVFGDLCLPAGIFAQMPGETRNRFFFPVGDEYAVRREADIGQSVQQSFLVIVGGKIFDFFNMGSYFVLFSKEADFLGSLQQQPSESTFRLSGQSHGNKDHRSI